MSQGSIPGFGGGPAPGPTIAFTVFGTPQTAGSKRGYVRGGRAIIVDDNKKSRPWKDGVAQVAGEAMVEKGLELLDGPVRVVFRFVMTRPKGHFKKDGTLSASGRRAPYPAVKPDTVKLTRAVEDALSGVVYRDDARIVDHRLLKEYGSPERFEAFIFDLSHHVES